MSNSVSVTAEMSAAVWKIEIAVGSIVAEGDVLLLLESMKMEIPVEAPSAGVVAKVCVTPEQSVQEGDVLVVIDVSA